MELGLALTLCGLGISFLIPAAILAFIVSKKERFCIAESTALVIDITTSRTSDGISYHPVYEYFVGGERYIGTGAYISNRVPAVGTTVPILYNPSDPQKSYIPGYDNRALRLLSIIFAVIGFIPIVICACIALFA